MGWLGVLVLIVGVLLAYWGWTTHGTFEVLTGVGFIITGAAITPWPGPWR